MPGGLLSAISGILAGGILGFGAAGMCFVGHLCMILLCGLVFCCFLEQDLSIRRLTCYGGHLEPSCLCLCWLFGFFVWFGLFVLCVCFFGLFLVFAVFCLCGRFCVALLSLLWQDFDSA